MNLSTPLNFGRRPCDRLLVRNLAAVGVERSEALWMAFLVWQDFATAREDRREVPTDEAERAKSDSVAILEEFIGWEKHEGSFVAAGIEAGFFLLTPVAEDRAELVLAEFYPANASATRLGNSELGGIGKSFSRIRGQAEIEAGDQLRLFEKTGGLEMDGVTEQQKKKALKLVFAICMALKRQKPSDETWKATLIGKALNVVNEVRAEDRDSVIKWMLKNRDNQRIGLRLDLVLDQFKDFVPEARQMFQR